MARMFAVIAAFIISLIPATANAPVTYFAVALPCGEMSAMMAALAKYKEKPFVTAVDPKGIPLELRVNPETRTFTLLMINPDGLVCLVAAGRELSSASDLGQSL